jgi:hypothetical protein
LRTLSEIVEMELTERDPVPMNWEEVEKVITSIKRISDLSGDGIHDKEMELLRGLAESLFELRLAKGLEDKRIEGFDERLSQILNGIKRAYVALISGDVPIKGGKVLCRCKSNLNLKGGKGVKTGDLVVMEFWQALTLMIAGYLSVVCRDGREIQ